MQWNKAGRPSNKQKDKPEWLEQAWTKEEQSIIIATENSSIVMLGIAVIKQWIRDGKSKSEYEGIKPWIQIIKDSLSDKNASMQDPALPVDYN